MCFLQILPHIFIIPAHFLLVPVTSIDNHIIYTHLSPRGVNKPKGPKLIRVRNYHKLDFDRLAELMSGDTYQAITQITNLDESTEQFSTITLSIKVKHKSSPWARDAVTREARIKRDMAHIKAIKFGTPEHWRKYKALRNKANSVLRSAKALYYRQLSDDLRQNPRKFWKEFHRLSKTSASTCIPEHTPDELNNYLLTVVSNDSTSPDSDPLSYLQHPNGPVPHFELETVDDDLVSKLLSNLNQNTATGSENIPARFLKTCNHLIAQPLSHLINRSLEEAYVPAIWKQANVTPIHKGGSKVITNYRPISVLPVISKVIERVFMLQLAHHLIEQTCFHPTSQALGLVNTPLMM